MRVIPVLAAFGVAVVALLGELTDDLAAGTAGSDPAALADQLALVMEGVYAFVQTLGADGPARRARALAGTLIDVASRR